MSNVLLLNHSEEVIGVRPLERAIRLLMKGKAKAPYGFTDFHEVRTPDGVMKVPTVLTMVYYVRIPYRNVPCTKLNIMRRDGFSCQYCNKKLTYAQGTIDHVLPQSRGGKHHWANVVTACRDCNGKKDNLTPQEAQMKLLCMPYIPKHDLMLIHASGRRGSWERWLFT